MPTPILKRAIISRLRIIIFAVCLCTYLATATPSAQAQDDGIHFDDVEFDFDSGGDFSFDDALFADAFDEGSDDSSWLDPFTFKISQQLFGQVNSHGVDLAPGFSIPRQADIESNRLALNVRYQNPFAAGWLLQASAQAKAFWTDDYEYVANDNNIDTEFRLNELFVQRSFSNSSIKFGRQTVVWGETIGGSVLDVINVTEFRDFTIIDFEDARLNQFMLVHEFFGKSSNLSSFINLYPEFNPPPVRGSPIFFEPRFNLTDFKRDRPLFEAGTRWSKSFEGADLSIMAAYLYENQLRYRDPSTGAGDAIAEHNDFVLLGVSANRAIGKLLLTFDLAYNHNILADSAVALVGNGSLQATSLRKDQIGTSLGFEYALSNEQSLSAAVTVQKVLDENEGLAPGQTLTNDGLTGSWLIRYGTTLLNQDLSVNASFQGDLDAEFLIASFNISYVLNDSWSVSGQLTAFTADDNSPLLFFDEDIRVGFTVSYSF